MHLSFDICLSPSDAACHVRGRYSTVTYVNRGSTFALRRRLSRWAAAKGTKGNNLKGCELFYLKAMPGFRTWLSYVCQFARQRACETLHARSHPVIFERKGGRSDSGASLNPAFRSSLLHWHTVAPYGMPKFGCAPSCSNRTGHPGDANITPGCAGITTTSHKCAAVPRWARI